MSSRRGPTPLDEAIRNAPKGPCIPGERGPTKGIHLHTLMNLVGTGLFPARPSHENVLDELLFLHDDSFPMKKTARGLPSCTVTIPTSDWQAHLQEVYETIKESRSEGYRVLLHPPRCPSDHGIPVGDMYVGWSFACLA